MALVDEVKIALRVAGKATDGEIEMWINAALADMARVGIDETLLNPENLAALPKAAVMCYAKAHYGYDIDERPQFDSSYRSIVCDLLNSEANTASVKDDEEAEEGKAN